MKAVKGFFLSLIRNLEAAVENAIENSEFNYIMPECNQHIDKPLFVK